MKKQFDGLFGKFFHVEKMLSEYQVLYYKKFGLLGNPHRGQGRILSVLKLKPEISQKELGYLLDMRNQSLGEFLSKLEKYGAIIRETSDVDRRSMNIKLTENGAKLIEQSDSKQDGINDIFDCLSADDQSKLDEILDRLSNELAKQIENIKSSHNETERAKGT